MNDSIVGTRIGIYDVLYECDYKAKDGHKLYHVKCYKCNWETDMIKSHIKKASKCTHVGLGGKYINTCVRWSDKRLEGIFCGMKSRCYNTNDKSYRWYGAKGIEICDEWLNNPKLFEEWALNNGYDDDLTIDRKDENKNYCPENCRWIPLQDNSKYKSTTSMIEVDGKVCTGREWADELGIGTNVINTYIREHGEDNTKEFIRRYMKDPGQKPKHKESFYDLYMNGENSVSC